MSLLDSNFVQFVSILEDRASKMINFVGLLLGFLVLAITTFKSGSVVFFDNLIMYQLFASVYCLIMCLIFSLCIVFDTSVLNVSSDYIVQKAKTRLLRYFEMSFAYLGMGLVLIGFMLVSVAFKSTEVGMILMVACFLSMGLFLIFYMYKDR